MKVSIAISNYNYENFLVECIDSVLEQTYRDLEIIIIDDGSTDGSAGLIEKHYRKNEFVKFITKSNGGQLSAFNEAVKHATGDIICFLDSDDLYKENYIERIVSLYRDNLEIDFIFCEQEVLYPDGSREIQKLYPASMDLGFSVVSALYSREWLGSTTSCISLRMSLVYKILPIPYEGDWITRADDILVWGGSLFGARKYYCAEPLVVYRVHDNNNYFGKSFSNYAEYKRNYAINRLFKYFRNKAGISGDIIDIICIEFESRTNKDVALLMRYLKILRYDRGFTCKLKKSFRLVRACLRDSL